MVTSLFKCPLELKRCVSSVFFLSLEQVSQDSLESDGVDNRGKVRMKSSVEMKRFKERWKKAVKDDRCWVDPY